MYERLKRLYQAGELNEKGLDRAVKFGWITDEQKKEIIASRA